jgi:hypothetical protein
LSGPVLYRILEVVEDASHYEGCPRRVDPDGACWCDEMDRYGKGD